MKAMILAAGMGTRLRPFTETRPKALVELGGRTLLEITLTRLRDAGITDVIINAHHFSDMIADYLKSKRNFGMKIQVSIEDVLLETGGGLKKASHFFLNSEAEEPFLLHNVDVISNIDLRRMSQSHIDGHALATLAVQDRKTSRYLLFTAGEELCGRRFAKDSPAERVGTGARAQALAFCGIHVISPRLLNMISEQGAFSIIDTYLRLASLGERILGFRADEFYWRDLGTPENLAAAEKDLRQTSIIF